MKLRFWHVLVLALIAIVLGVVGWNEYLRRSGNQGILPITPPVSVHLTMGNPSNASNNPLINVDNYLILKPQYAVSYNKSKNIPNWSSWQLNKSWLGTVPRSNNFRPDPTLPQGWYQVKPSDYNGSGYDRGHLTPSADRGNNPENNSATFLMTNILPQAPDNNRGPWEQLESYSRDLVNQGRELYIVAGGYGDKRKMSKGNARVAVPDSMWKVIVVLDRLGQGAAGVNENTRVIAVEIPNEQGIKQIDWRQFRVSIDEIEAKTGYNFLTTVPEAVQQIVESRVDQR